MSQWIPDLATAKVSTLSKHIVSSFVKKGEALIREASFQKNAKSGQVAYKYTHKSEKVGYELLLVSNTFDHIWKGVKKNPYFLGFWVDRGQKS